MMAEKDNNTDVKKRNVLDEVGDESNRKNTVNRHERRGFLRGTLASMGGILATALGFSSRASATNAVRAIEATRGYTSEDAVRKAVQQYVAGPLRKLRQEGYIEQSYISELPTAEIDHTPKTFAEADEGTLVGATPSDGEPTVQIQIKHRLSDSRKLLLIIEPLSGKSRAILQSVSTIGSTSTVRTAARTANGDVTIQDDCSYCSTKYYCEETCSVKFGCECDEVKLHYCDGGDDSHCDYCETVGSCCGDDSCTL